jgi:hypothetical protein
MRKDKEEIFRLRKSGKSYQEIHIEMGVPRSTLSEWFGSQNWSKDISRELIKKAQKGHVVRIQELNRVRGENLKKLYQQAEKEAEEDFSTLKYHPLFIAGLMIYWGEGNKASPYRVGIANTEPRMIKLFVHFLRTVCSMDLSKINAWILIYPDLNVDECMKYWVENSGLGKDSFHKTMAIVGKHKTRKLSYGVCSVGVSSAYLKRKIMKWIELLSEDLVQENYMRV